MTFAKKVENSKEYQAFCGRWFRMCVIVIGLLQYRNLLTLSAHFKMLTSRLVKALSLAGLMIFTGVVSSFGQGRDSRNTGRDNNKQSNGNRQSDNRAGAGRVSQTPKGRQPQWGAPVKSAPGNTKVVVHQSGNYQYRDGVFYRPNPAGAYVAGPAPVGFRISILPTGFTRLVIGGIPYFYYYGTYYRRYGQLEYEVVNPPIGAIIYDLPLGYERVSISGVTYYFYDETYYKAIIDQYGEVAYEVVGKVR